MTFAFPPTTAPFVKCVDCHATLGRLIGNLSGFLYRRRHDRLWTIEFISAGCRDITGYDPHRFIANASITYGDLIARSDRDRVNERVRRAVLRGRRATVEYRIRTAYGEWMKVEDRFVPVLNSAGDILAIEGVVGRVRCPPALPPFAPSQADAARLSALCNPHCLN